MIDATQKKFCRAFGLTIASDFPLPELPYVNLEENPADIVIKKSDLSKLWQELAEPNRYFVVKEDFVMFEIPDVAVYLVKNGREIFVSPIAGSEEDQIRLFILGSCMGAILLQRRILPLHGSAVVIDGEAYAIVGDSGAGKSTLASAFLRRDCQLLSDDVIPVSLSKERIPVVIPAYPQQKLWLESLKQFGMESKRLRPIINRETKFAVPISTQFATAPTPLTGVFELIKTENDQIEIYPVQNLNRLHTLFRHTYRNFLIARLGIMDWHFNITAKMVSHIKIYQLCRPASRFTANELVDFTITKLNKGEMII